MGLMKKKQRKRRVFIERIDADEEEPSKPNNA